VAWPDLHVQRIFLLLYGNWIKVAERPSIEVRRTVRKTWSDLDKRCEHLDLG
jgi:hypothetical protein